MYTSMLIGSIVHKVGGVTRAIASPFLMQAHTVEDDFRMEHNTES